MADAVAAVAAQVRENVRLRRAFLLSTGTGQAQVSSLCSPGALSSACLHVQPHRLAEHGMDGSDLLAAVDAGIVSAYLHQSPAPGLCRIASLVVVEPAAAEAPSHAMTQASERALCARWDASAAGQRGDQRIRQRRGVR